MDVAKVLKDSWQAVQDSGVPKELQGTAFSRAIDLYAAPAGQPPKASAASAWRSDSTSASPAAAR